MDHQKSKSVPEKHLLHFYWLHQSLWQTVIYKTNMNFLIWQQKEFAYISLGDKHILFDPTSLSDETCYLFSKIYWLTRTNELETKY